MEQVTKYLKTSVYLAGLGAAFVILFFKKGLIPSGSILVISGLAYLFGLVRTFSFCSRRENRGAMGLVLGGICVILIGLPIIGLILEIFGYILLYRGSLLFGVNDVRRLLARMKSNLKSGLASLKGLKLILKLLYAMKGIAVFLGAMVVVLFRWSIIGITIYGFFLLLRKLFPKEIEIVRKSIQQNSVYLAGLGVAFVILFFKKELIPSGSIVVIFGLAYLFGLERSFSFCFQWENIGAMGFVLGGIFVILKGWPIIGLILEIFGYILLCRGYYQAAIDFVKNHATDFVKKLREIRQIFSTFWLAFVTGLKERSKSLIQNQKIIGVVLGGIFAALLGWPVLGMSFGILGLFFSFCGSFPRGVNDVRRLLARMKSPCSFSWDSNLRWLLFGLCLMAAMVCVVTSVVTGWGLHKHLLEWSDEDDDEGE